MLIMVINTVGGFLVHLYRHFEKTYVDVNTLHLGNQSISSLVPRPIGIISESKQERTVRFGQIYRSSEPNRIKTPADSRQ